MIDRRSILRAALFVAAAPVIVRASSLMRVRALSVGDGMPLFATSHPFNDLVVAGVYCGPPVEIAPDFDRFHPGDIVFEGTARYRLIKNSPFLVTDPETLIPVRSASAGYTVGDMIRMVRGT